KRVSERAASGAVAGNGGDLHARRVIDADGRPPGYRVEDLLHRSADVATVRSRPNLNRGVDANPLGRVNWPFFGDRPLLGVDLTFLRPDVLRSWQAGNRRAEQLHVPVHRLAELLGLVDQ